MSELMLYPLNSVFDASKMEIYITLPATAHITTANFYDSIEMLCFVRLYMRAKVCERKAFGPTNF